MAFRTANPVLSEKMFERASHAMETPTTMTVEGAIWKSLVLLGVLVVCAGFSWARFMQGGIEAVYPTMWAGLIGGSVLALFCCFKAQWSPFIAPIYAACEGLLIGGLSAVVESQPDMKGIVFQAVALTFGIFAAVLMLYISRTIRATEKFRVGIMAATFGIFLVYMVSLLIRVFGGGGIPFLHEGGALGIGISLFIIVIAALNFVLDFDLIEKGAASGAPKYMEWYGAFGLLVTLVWLYIEVLRLLIKLRGRD